MNGKPKAEMDAEAICIMTEIRNNIIARQCAMLTDNDVLAALREFKTRYAAGDFNDAEGRDIFAVMTSFYGENTL